MPINCVIKNKESSGSGSESGSQSGIGIRSYIKPVDFRIEISHEPIPTPIPTPTPKVAVICPAVRGKPKPRLLGVVDYWHSKWKTAWEIVLIFVEFRPILRVISPGG